MFLVCFVGAVLSVMFGRGSLLAGEDAVPFVVLGCVFLVGLFVSAGK